jgi:hypothetical protein
VRVPYHTCLEAYLIQSGTLEEATSSHATPSHPSVSLSHRFNHPFAKDESLVAKAPGLGALARDGSDDSSAVPGTLDQVVSLLVAGAGGGGRVLRKGDGVGALVLDLAGAKGVWWGRGQRKEDGRLERRVSGGRGEGAF